MRTRLDAAEMYEYWANKHEERVNDILDVLELYDTEARSHLIEQMAYLVADADVLRKHARSLRLNPGSGGSC
jgi:hypothetical protein